MTDEQRALLEELARQFEEAAREVGACASRADGANAAELAAGADKHASYARAIRAAITPTGPDDGSGGSGVPGFFGQWPGDESEAELMNERETEPREPGCACHLEIGDSPCDVHPSHDDLYDREAYEACLAEVERERPHAVPEDKAHLLADKLKLAHTDGPCERCRVIKAFTDGAETPEQTIERLTRERDEARALVARVVTRLVDLTVALDGISREKAEKALRDVSEMLDVSSVLAVLREMLR